MTKMSAAEVRAAAAKRHYGDTILGNVERGDIAEEIVAASLDPNWRYHGGVFAGWDFEHRDTKTRLELKQSARLQKWPQPQVRPPRFSIARKTGYYVDGTHWIQLPSPIRLADIYIFAWHGCDSETMCDQADPTQWQFYVVPTAQLPDRNTVTLDDIQRMGRAYNADELPAAVEAARCTETVRCDVAHRWPCCP